MLCESKFITEDPTEPQGAAAAQAASQLQLDLISPNGAWSGTAGDALVRLLNSVGDSVASSALFVHTYAVIDSDCRAIFDHFDGDINRRRTCEFLAMITELLMQRDRALFPGAALRLAAALSASPLFVRNDGNWDEMEYDEFAQAVRGGLFASHLPPDLTPRVARAVHMPRQN